MRSTGKLISEFGFDTLDGTRWNSRDVADCEFRLLVIYSGMWCPFCTAQLQELNALHDRFSNVGVLPAAVSADNRDRAALSQKDYALDRLRIGYKMPNTAGREMGAFISTGINEKKMPLSCESASFLINSANRVHEAWIASNVFARTQISQIYDYIGFLNAHPSRAPCGSA